MPSRPIPSCPWPTSRPVPPGFLWRVVLLGAAVAAGVGLLALAVAGAGVVTLPPASRADALCGALGTEAPCATVELGHVRATLTILAYDQQPEPLQVWGLLAFRRRAYAWPLATNGARDEAEVLAVVGDPRTLWTDTVADSRTWALVRALVGVPTGVPVVQQAVHVPGDVTASDDPVLASSTRLRLRIGLMGLRE